MTDADKTWIDNCHCCLSLNPSNLIPVQLLKSNQHSGYITQVVTLYHQDAVDCVYQPWSHFQNRAYHHGCCRAEQFAYGKTAGCLQRPGYNVHQ